MRILADLAHSQDQSLLMLISWGHLGQESLLSCGVRPGFLCSLCHFLATWTTALTIFFC